MDDVLKFFEALKGNRILDALLFTIGAFLLFHQLFTGFLFFRKEVKLTVWKITVGVVVVWLLGYYIKPSETTPIDPKDYKVYKGEKFGQQQIHVDGKRFERCAFNGTTFVISSLNGTELVESKISTDCKFAFAGPAQRTIMTFTELYQTPELRAGVEQAFENIRKGTFPRVDPVNKIADP